MKVQVTFHYVNFLFTLSCDSYYRLLKHAQVFRQLWFPRLVKEPYIINITCLPQERPVCVPLSVV